MPRRRSLVVPIHMQIAQIDHSLYPPRPQPDDAMSIASNQMNDNDPRKSPEEIVLEDEDEATRPEDFSPRLWQLFSRIQRRGTEPLFPADWQVPLNSNKPLTHQKLDFLNIPPSLFHPPGAENVTRPIISSLGTFKGSEFRGKQAFEKLTLLGQTVRNRIELNHEMAIQTPMKVARFLPVEPIIHADCEKFVQWAEKDGSGGKRESLLERNC